MSNLNEALQDGAENSTTIVSDGNPADIGQSPSPKQSFEEMRSSPRMNFQINQRIAPMLGDYLPQIDEYINVECNDLSRGGISFFLKRPPGCERFAIMLGQKPAITVLIAQVANLKEVRHNEQQMYLVGCKFVDRGQT